MGTPLAPEVFCLKNMSAGYDERPILQDITGVIRQGELIALVGANGSGKSTFLKVLAHDIPWVKGQCIVQNVEPYGLAYLPQRQEFDLRFPLSVYDLVAMGAWKSVGLWRSTKTVDTAIREALCSVDMEHMNAQPIASLSGGQIQRVLFARILLQDPQVILLDEPFNGVDAHTTVLLLEQVRSWVKKGKTVLVSTHNLTQVFERFPLTILLAQRIIGWGPTHRVLSEDNLSLVRQLSQEWKDASRDCRLPHKDWL